MSNEFDVNQFAEDLKQRYPDWKDSVLKASVLDNIGNGGHEKTTRGGEVLLQLAKELYTGGRILEIGTRNGISAVILAQVGPVVTYDVKKRFLIDDIWAWQGVQDRVEFRFRGQDPLDMSDVGLAFIDGDHSYDSVKQDFEEVKGCGRVIFHDCLHIRGVNEFIDGLNGDVQIKQSYFAVWRSDDD